MASEQSRQLLHYSPRVSDVQTSAATQSTRHKYNTLLKTLGKTRKTGGSRLTDSHVQTLRDSLDAIGSSTSDTQRGGEDGVAESSYVSVDAANPTNDVGSEDELVSAAILKSTAGALSVTMDRILQEALDVEEQLEWWHSVEGSRWNTAYFLLQTTPVRLFRLTHEIVVIANRNHVDFTWANLNLTTFRSQIQPHIQAFRSLFPTFSKHQGSLLGSLDGGALDFAARECLAHRKELEAIRDRRAAQLGELAFLGNTLLAALEDVEGSFDSGMKTSLQSSSLGTGYLGVSQVLASKMEEIVLSKEDTGSSDLPQSNEQKDFSESASVSSLAVSQSLQTYLGPKGALFTHSTHHASQVNPHLRPSRWTLAWPRLVLFPPLLLLGIRSAYHNRTSISASISEAGETIRGFWTQWVVEPVVDILRTVRTGSGAGEEGGRVISRDGLKSDMDSLERMVVALATDKSSLSDEELQHLGTQIRQGDLTSVLKVYEDDIKKPVRSAISGTLIRSLLIQVQKAKVDIDFALSGIDKLLKSQELTFGFVGVAPSLAVLYVVGGWLREVIGLGRPRSKGKFGGKARRRASFYSMRRIERLITQGHSNQDANSHVASIYGALSISINPHDPSSSSNPAGTSSSLPTASTSTGELPLDAKTHGLVMLYLTSLRQYAEDYFPRRSRIREAFLDDLSDLENPKLGKEDKLKVVARMWRSWGGILGWGMSDVVV